MKRFNEEMLKLEDLIELIALEALISRVREKHLWKELYALLDRRLLYSSKGDKYIVPRSSLFL